MRYDRACVFEENSFSLIKVRKKLYGGKKKMRKFILLKQIKFKQKSMYSKAKHFGFTHPAVVSCSQELDTLLNRYQNFDLNR